MGKDLVEGSDGAGGALGSSRGGSGIGEGGGGGTRGSFEWEKEELERELVGGLVVGVGVFYHRYSSNRRVTPPCARMVWMDNGARLQYNRAIRSTVLCTWKKGSMQCN